MMDVSQSVLIYPSVSSILSLSSHVCMRVDPSNLSTGRVVLGVISPRAPSTTITEVADSIEVNYKTS